MSKRYNIMHGIGRLSMSSIIMTGLRSTKMAATFMILKYVRT